jgi:hypothetical protein
MDVQNANHYVLTKHHLTKASRIDDVVQVVEDIVGLHASIATTPYLSLLARCPDFRKEALDEELYAQRSLGRIRCVRKTIYVLSQAMMPYAYQATASMVQRVSRQYLEFRGVSPEEYDLLSRHILDLVQTQKEGMTASATKKALQTQRDISAVLYLMCDQGLLVRGQPERGWKDQQHRYLPFSECFPDVDLNSVGEEEAISWLARHYLRAFGPATEDDVVWWLGVGKRKTQKALANLHHEISTVHVPPLEGELLMLSSDLDRMRQVGRPARPTVNLLPGLDPYLMGYKDRARYLDQGHSRYVFDRSGNATSTILLDGHVVGIWDFDSSSTPTVKLHLLCPPDQISRERIHAEASRVGRFMAEQDVQVRECGAMIPLTERSAGSVMSPLKDC